MATRLLLIDSDAKFARELGAALESLGFEIETTANTESAIQLAKIDPPTAVVIGLMDALGTGYGLCSKLRRRVPTLPVFMVLDAGEAGSDRLARHQMLKTRASSYLVRPFSIEAFYRTLSQALPRPLPVRTEDLSRYVGETDASDSQFEGNLFDADELDAIAAEADLAFDSLLVDTSHAPSEPIMPTGALPDISQPDAAVEFALSDADIEEIPFDEPASLDDDADLLALDRDLANLMDAPDDFGGDLGHDSLIGSQTTDTTPLSPMPSSAAPPVAARAVGTPRTATGAIDDVTISRDDMRALRARVVELKQEARLAHDELDRRRDDASRRRSVDNASRKESMQLRGKLGDREKELLELRGQLDGRDQSLIEANEQTDNLRADQEMLKSDLRHAEAKTAASAAAREDAFAEIRRLEVLLSQSSEDLAASDLALEAAQAETDAVRQAGEATLEAANQAHAEARAEQDEGHIVALAASQAAADNARAEVDQRLLDQRQGFDLELETLRTAHQAKIGEAEAQAELQRNALADEHTVSTIELESEHEQAIEAKDAQRIEAAEAARKAQAAAVEKLEGDIAELMSAAALVEQDHQEALTGLQAEVAQLKEAAEAEATAHTEAIAAAAKQQTEALAAQKADLGAAAADDDMAHTEALQAKEDAHQLALDDADDRFLLETGKLDERVQTLEKALKETDAERAQVTTSLAATTTELAAAIAATSALTETLTETERVQSDAIAERDARIVDIEGQSAVRIERLAKLEASIGGLTEEIEVWEAEVSQHEEQAVAFNSTIAARDASIEAQQAELSTRTVELAALATTLAERDGALETQQATIATRTEELTIFETTLTEYETTIEGLQGDLSARGTQIDALELERSQLTHALEAQQGKATQLDELVEKARSAMSVAQAFLDHTQATAQSGAPEAHAAPSDAPQPDTEESDNT